MTKNTATLRQTFARSAVVIAIFVGGMLTGFCMKPVHADESLGKIENLYNGVQCPNCSHKEWGNLPFVGEIPPRDPGHRSIPLNLKICTTCGYARMFIDRWAESHQDSQVK